MDRLHQWTALVEQISIDEAFLGLSDLPEEAESLARRLQGEIRKALGLPCSLGVAPHKIIGTIGDLTRWNETDLVKIFGKTGYDLARHARGIDESPMVTEHEAKSISQE